MKIISILTLLILCIARFPAQQPTGSGVEDKTFALVSAYEKECGSPLAESQTHTFRTGRIIGINSERSVTFLQERADGNLSKKRFVVLLAGVNARGNENAVRDFLNKNLLNQEVEISGNLGRASDRKFEGLIFLKNEKLPEIDWVGEYLIENGMARFTESNSSFYGVSDYSLCVSKQLEEKAKREKLGIWAKTMN